MGIFVPFITKPLHPSLWIMKNVVRSQIEWLSGRSSHWQKFILCWKSAKRCSCLICTLYGWNLRSYCVIRLNVDFVTCATLFLLQLWRGSWSRLCLTLSMFSGVRTDLLLPDLSLFRFLLMPSTLYLTTFLSIVDLHGARLLKRTSNSSCTLFTFRFVWAYLRTMKALCSGVNCCPTMIEKCSFIFENENEQYDGMMLF